MLFNKTIAALFIFITTLLAINATAGPFQRYRENRQLGEGVFANQRLTANQDVKLININGTERSYIIHKPINHYGKSPLVIMLHGGGGNAYNGERMSVFDEIADREGFTVIYPNGTGRFKNILLTWNANHCCEYAMLNNIDDIAFISKLIDEMILNENIDPKRVYITGMSNGAMMTHQAAIALSDKIAAIATVVGTVFGDEPKAKNPMPALIINGMEDNEIPIDGGTPNGRSKFAWDNIVLPPTNAQAIYWAKNNNCSTNYSRSENDKMIIDTYKCQNYKYNVTQIIVKDNGHAWPGGQKGSKNGDAPSNSLNASEVIWNFFKTHPKS